MSIFPGAFMNILETYQERLPWHGYATDNLKAGLRVYALADLVKKQFVQHNPKHSICWLCYDIDSETASADWIDQEAPIPNIIILNPGNGHAHIHYGLETPVHNYFKASDKAKRYMSAIDIALTYKLDADPGYSKLISKNPLNDRWQVVIPRNELYTLDTLAKGLDLTGLVDRRRKIEAFGLGRNETVFHAVRKWAYTERRKSQQYFNLEMFKEAVKWRALAVNAEFSAPLPHDEIRHITKSIASWTWKNLSPEGFKTWQKRKSEAGNRVKSEKSARLKAEIIKAIEQCPELSQKDIADMYGVTQKTVSVTLRQAKENYTFPISDRGAVNAV